MNGPRALIGALVGWSTWPRRIAGVAMAIGLIILTQVLGVLLWPAMGLATTHGGRAAATVGFALVVLSAWLVPPLAALGGREPLPCLSDGPLRPRSWLFCAAHRHYVRPQLRTALEHIAADVARAHPGTVVRYLDAGFPFGGMPLLPHLSHHDGRKVDLALFAVDARGQPVDGGGSPVGYFGYVAPTGRPACPARVFDLRWDFDTLQPAIALRLDDARTRTLLQRTVQHPAIGKVLLEPHLVRRLGVRAGKVRFQGCRAARHDDPMHIQLGKGSGRRPAIIE